MSEPSIPSPLFQSVQQAFAQASWQCQQVSNGQEVLRAGFEAHNTRVELHVQVFAQVKSLSIVSEASFKVSPVRRSIVAELLMRTNQQLSVGGFEMDWDSGAIYFRISNVFTVDSGDAVEQMIAGLVRANIVEMDRITPFLGEIEKIADEALAGVDVARLMLRQDLLPQVPAHG